MAEGGDSKCGICLSFVFTEPKLLDCYHIFCLPCLQKLDMSDNKIICPLCKTNIALPDKGVGGLKSYPFKLKCLTEEKPVMDSCDLCDDQNIAVSKCCDCKINLCSNCRDYHGKLKTSKNHELQSLNVFNSELDQNGSNVKEKCIEHGKEFTLFCKPCNCLICITCSEKNHRRHQVEKLFVLLQSKKEKLLVGIASFKARISILQHTAEIVELKKENYDKHCLVLKQYVTSHTTNLKDQFCRTVDELSNKNLDVIDEMRKRDMNKLDSYMNQIETEKKSLSGLIFTTEDFVNKSSVTYLIEEFSAIGKRLDNVLWKSVNVFPTIYDLNFESNVITKDVIEAIFGKVTARSRVSETKPMYPHLPLPELGLLPVYKAKQISEFVLENDILDIVPASNDNAWLLTETSMCMLSYKGISEKSGHNVDKLPKPTRIVRKTANELWLWFGGSVFKIERKISKKVGFKVPFKNALFCCAVNNGNVFVYNECETKFYELSDNDGVQNEFEIKDFLKNISRRMNHSFLQYNNRVKRVVMKQSKNLNFVISIGDDCVLFIDKNFKVLNTFWKSGAEFNAIAMDNYANVILADSKNGNIYMLSENGVFKQDLFSQNEGICNTTDMIVDECGYIWLVGYSRKIQVYSYQ